jgi:phage tail sheath protein FI
MTAGLGVTVVEVDGRTAPSLGTAATSVAGLLVRARRGVPNQPVRVRGFTDFVATFGSYARGSFGAYAVRGFFDNGGADAFVVRAVGVGARPASAVLADRTGATTLTVTAGARGRPDPGEWGNALTVRVEDHPRGSSRLPAQLVGTRAEPFAVDVGTPLTVDVVVQGTSSTVTVVMEAAAFATPGAASAEEVARALNRQTTALRAGVVPGGRLVLSATAMAPGVWTRLVVTGGGTELGFADGVASDGALDVKRTAVAVASGSGFVTGSAVALTSRGHVVGTAPVGALADGSAIVVTANGTATGETLTFRAGDFADPAAATTREVAAAVNRQAGAVTAEVTGDDRLVLLSRREGPGSTVAVTAPAAPAADARGALGLGTAAPVAGAEAFRQLSAASETYRVLAWTDGADLPTLVPGATSVRSAEYDLVVLLDGEEVERFSSLSMVDGHPGYAEAVVNDPVAGSGYVIVADEDSTSGPARDVPVAGSTRLGTATGTAGQDGGVPTDIDLIGDPAARTGLEAFNGVPIQLLGCPESTSPGVTAACLAYCERRGDAMFVGTVPPGLDLEAAAGYAAGLRGRKVYGALYAPWIDVVNPLDRTGAQPTVRIPPVGQVLGVYARIADTRGAWKAPAGDEARLLDAVGVEFAMTDADHTSLVRAAGVNGIRAIPGSGIVVDASRTLSTDSRWLFVNVRRLFNLVKSSLRDGLTWVAQEPNTEALRRSVAFNVVTPFLLGLWRQGAFGSDPPQQVFTVRCDASNNSPADVQQGLFTVEVLFYPTKPAESILVVVGQQDSGAGTSES